MIRFLILLFFAFSLSGCTAALNPFVKFHPQQKQDFSDHRPPAQNSIAALQAENPKNSGIIVPSVDSTYTTQPNTRMREVPNLEPVVIKEYNNEIQTVYQLEDTEQVATYVQVVEVERALRNPPILNHKRSEIAQELMQYESNYIEHPSDNFFAKAHEIPAVPSHGYNEYATHYPHEHHPYPLPHDHEGEKRWRHHAPYYYDAQYFDSDRPHYLQDLQYVQQPAYIPESEYEHYPKMLRYEDEEWEAMDVHNTEFLNYYNLKNHKNSRSIREYEHFFSID